MLMVMAHRHHVFPFPYDSPLKAISLNVIDSIVSHRKLAYNVRIHCNRYD